MLDSASMRYVTFQDFEFYVPTRKVKRTELVPKIRVTLRLRPVPSLVPVGPFRLPRHAAARS